MADYVQLIDIGKDITFSSADPTTGAITCQTGDATDSTAVGDDGDELWAPAGYYAVPAAPTPGQSSCQAFKIKNSDYDAVIATRDPRDAKVVGNLRQGDRVIAGGFPSQSRLYVRNNGKVVLQTTDDNTGDGNVVYFAVGPEEARFYAPFGGHWLDKTGFHVRTWQGAKLDMGGAAFPAPVPGGSTFSVTADAARLNVSMLQVGKDTGLSSGVVSATTRAPIDASVAAALTATAAAISALAAACTAAGQSGANGAAATAVGLLGAAVTALSSAQLATQTRTTIA